LSDTRRQRHPVPVEKVIRPAGAHRHRARTAQAF
jgi:hypothetical protein